MSIETIFPNITLSGYSVTSPASPYYNCIAWAAGEEDRCWWPDPWHGYYWPSNVPRQVTLEAFVLAYESLGYVRCADKSLEPGIEKVALYASAQGEPTHAARQLPNGEWTSKLGKIEDIEHKLEGLIGSEYGSVVAFLKRRRPES